MQPRIIVLLPITVTKISFKSLLEKIQVRTIIRENTVPTTETTVQILIIVRVVNKLFDI